MPKTLFLFSGQGAQAPGMGLELAAASQQADAIFSCAQRVLGLDLKTLFAEASAEELAQTQIAQPAIFTTSLLALSCVQEAGIGFDGVAGHSLGEYAAMVASGVVSMEDGFTLIKHRAAAMARCAAANPGAMCAILGSTADQVEAVCAEIDGYVVPVNYNAPTQTVIAGTADALEAAMARFTEQGSRCMKLAVSAAFHSALMQSAADEFQAAIGGIVFQAPQKEFFSNVTGGVLTDFSDMPAYLARHIASPVRFTDELTAAQAAGYQNYVELGPGRVLSGLVKKTLSDVQILSVENQKFLDKTKAAFAG